MRRIFALAAAVTVVTCSPPPSPPPVMERPREQELTGADALCEDITQLRSERGPDGPTVYYCADAP